jgi:hypothetical protein
VKHLGKKGAKELAEELMKKGADDAAKSDGATSAYVDRGRRIVSGAVPAFDKAKTKFYDEPTKAFIRYDRKTGVAVVMRDGINGPVHTAFQQNRPSGNWNPIPYGSGK